jgi:hypothetical protein
VALDRQQRQALDRHILGNEDRAFDQHFFPEYEVDALCPHCGLTQDQHLEASREDQYGNDYEYLECPPEDCRSGVALAHWLKRGCAEATMMAVNDKGDPFCIGCGEVL